MGKALLYLFIVAVLCAGFAIPAAYSLPRDKGIRVAVSIYPVYSLVAAIADGADEIDIELVIPSNLSPHDYMLNPKTAKKLGEADIIFVIAHEFEVFASRLKIKQGQVLKELGKERIRLLSSRQSGLWKEDHEGSSHSHKHGAEDYHIWLDAGNAIIMGETIAETLKAALPQKEALFTENLKKLTTTLLEFDGKAKEVLSKDIPPFIVMHDGYQYFEKAYGISSSGAILEASANTSVKRMMKLRRYIKDKKAICLFTEPQFNGRTADKLASDLGLKKLVIDPIGSMIKPDKDAYLTLMYNILEVFSHCSQ